jgi:hypothetical protein
MPLPPGRAQRARPAAILIVLGCNIYSLQSARANAVLSVWQETGMALERDSSFAASGRGADTGAPVSETATTRDVGRYVAAMCAELHLMAQRSGLGVVAALLNLARAEAELAVEKRGSEMSDPR